MQICIGIHVIRLYAYVFLLKNLLAIYYRSVQSANKNILKSRNIKRDAYCLRKLQNKMFE